MKKSALILAIPAVVLFMATSCQGLNEYPVFDDANAFVSFDAIALTCSETDGTINIPVTLSSVAGVSATVHYEVVDGTAKAGKDYVVTNSDRTLAFGNGDSRFLTIPIEIVNHPGVYTGNLSFTVKFSDLGGVKDGDANTCTVTIEDIDHPLTYMFGTFDAFSGSDTWQLEISGDDNDGTVVWISNLFNLQDKAMIESMLFSAANTSTGIMTIAFGQQATVDAENEEEEDVVYQLAGISDKGNMAETGSINMAVSEDGGKLSIAVADTVSALGLYLVTIPEAKEDAKEEPEPVYTLHTSIALPVEAVREEPDAE